MDCTVCGGESQLRRRTVPKGAPQLVYQCLACGRAVSNAQSYGSVPHHESLPPWDEALAKRGETERDAALRLKSDLRRDQWRRDYESYLQTDTWHRRRELTLEREGGLCQGCRSNRATQVHHRSYEHFRHELLYELLALCDDCHALAHRAPTAVELAQLYPGILEDG
jgi:hypothetical protein